VRCGLSSCSRDQLCSPPAVLLWSWVFTVLDYWGLVSLPCPLSLGQGQCSVSWPPAVSVLWWFVDCFSIWKCHLTLDLLTGSGDELCRPLPALFQAAAYHPSTVGPSVLPAFVYWKFEWRSAPCSSPVLRHTYSTLTLLLCVSFQFLFYSVFWISFWRAEGQSVQGAMLVYPRGGWGNTVWHLVLTCWFAECLPSRFWASIWQFGLGVQGIEVLILLGALFLPNVSPASQQNFWFIELILSASAL
jgi:hypothetical protein